MTLLRHLGFANILKYQAKKINEVFPTTQNIWLVYVNTSFKIF